MIGLLISAYFWLPAIVESRYINGASVIGDMYKQHFLSVLYLIYSGWGFGTDVNSKNGLSPQVGVILFLFVAAGVIHFFKYRDKFIGFWLCIFFFAIFLSTSYSDIFWKNVLFLKLFEFPWRFTALSSLAAAVIGAYIIYTIKNKKITYCIAILLLISSFFYTTTDEQNKKDDKYYYSFTGSTVYRRAVSTMWMGGDPFKIPEKKIEIISGNGQINNLIRKSNFHSFTLTADSTVKILDNTVYFPGWKVKVDNKKVPIEFQDINHRGLITFNVSKGMRNVEVIFGNSPVRLFSNLLSLVTLTMIIILIMIKKYKKIHII